MKFQSQQRVSLNIEKNLIDLTGTQEPGNVNVSVEIWKLWCPAILQLKISERSVHIALLFVGLKKMKI